MNLESQPSESLFATISELINQCKNQIAVSVNVSMTQLYWQIGQMIRTEILANSRAEYGKQVVASLARQLTTFYGKGWSEKNLRHMMRFAEVFPDRDIVESLIRQLSWTHFLVLIPIDEPLKRAFYIEMARSKIINNET